MPRKESAMKSRILLGVLVSSWVLVPAMDSALAQFPSGTESRAQIRVLLPSPNAKLWLNDTPTRQQGACRVFVSPPLGEASGYTYTYVLKASWLEKGREVTRAKQVRVRPGQETLVDFTILEAPAERPLTPPIVPESERPLSPPIAPEPGREEPSRQA